MNFKLVFYVQRHENSEIDERMQMKFDLPNSLVGRDFLAELRANPLNGDAIMIDKEKVDEVMKALGDSIARYVALSVGSWPKVPQLPK